MVRSSKTTKGTTVRSRAARGFTILELVIVVAIGLILAGLAVPFIGNALRLYKMRSAIASIQSAISAARYQSIFTGCKTQISISKANYNYQFASQAPAVTGSACLAGFVNVGGPVPFMGNGVAINQDVVLTFTPGGAVSSVPVQAPLINIVLTYPGFAAVPQETVQVSSYGNITVTP
jgi:prepilin-type N-terminal cleavage/methylation domain-containing protein